jgi:hypothetical protein
MPDLATIADVNERSPRVLTSAEQTRATVLLGDASAAVRRYTKQTFTVVVNDLAVLRPVGAYLELPDMPVTAVHEVRGIDRDGTVLDPITGWAWDGLDRIDLTAAGFGLGEPWWPWTYGPESFQVDHNHGDNVVPDDIIRIVCGMVLRVIFAPSATEGMSSEHIGQYSYQMSQQVNGGSPGITVRLSEADKLDLSSYRKQVDSIQVRL